MKNIIFLFSLPRSGSTLLQRILMTHDKIYSVSEPWLLLPLFYTLKLKGNSAEYNFSTCYNAIQDLIKELPNGKKDYLEAIRFFVKSLYDKITADKTTYFLDKTPRYYFIIPEIAKTFPNAKFIFLFRNPLSIMSSMIETWHNGKITLGDNHKDLYIGPKLLTNGYELLKEKSIRINYEQLVNEPKKELEKIFEYLGLDFNEKIIENFQNSKLSGRMGDPNKYKHKKLETNLNDKWKKTFNTKSRRKYVKRYLNYLGNEIINSLGYNKNKLLDEIKKNKNDYKKSFFDKFNELFKIKSNIQHKIIQKIPPSIKKKIKNVIKNNE